jgi:hypothetical protein
MSARGICCPQQHPCQIWGASIQFAVKGQVQGGGFGGVNRSQALAEIPQLCDGLLVGAEHAVILDRIFVVRAVRVEM